MKHIYWTDGEVGGRFDVPASYPAIEATHLAAQMALYANLWSGNPVPEKDAPLFEQLYVLGDMPLFFDFKKSAALGWVAVERLGSAFLTDDH